LSGAGIGYDLTRKEDILRERNDKDHPIYATTTVNHTALGSDFPLRSFSCWYLNRKIRPYTGLEKYEYTRQQKKGEILLEISEKVLVQSVKLFNLYALDAKAFDHFGKNT
jgi:hypothetical protein